MPVGRNIGQHVREGLSRQELLLGKLKRCCRRIATSLQARTLPRYAIRISCLMTELESKGIKLQSSKMCRVRTHCTVYSCNTSLDAQKRRGGASNNLAVIVFDIEHL